MVRADMAKGYTKSHPVSTARGQRLFSLLSLLLCLTLLACGAAEQPKPSLEAEDPALVLWPRAEKAIQLRISSTRDLNMYDSRAHSIQVCVYQLDNPDAFVEAIKTPQGIAELLKAAPFDKSVKGVMRFFVQPLEESFLELDRAENATFVGIVCGYFDSTPEQSARLWEIKPTKTASGRLFWASTTYSAGTLERALRLTDHALVETQEQKTP